ncbi:diguanylate cyclase [Romboutsia weinsteinii]|uniref:Diguanylate cyclase n=1 Tax=Romboutsia weinsteinii TaxID=2020949 RepID=A0A371J5U4_9FIRM|nr:HD domain-containing phosphohydrolase [Romboutsia weinsteinii]RDY28047.1 diguanylate cyclase [Romboutsia weinsteinii]
MFENLLELLLDTMPYSVWIRDIDGKFIFANDFYCKNMNLTKKEILGKTVFDIYKEELAIEYTKNYKDVIDNQRPIEFSGYTNEDFLECYIAPMKKNGEIIAFLGILQNQTKRKRYEEEIIMQKNVLKTLIDTIPDSIFYKDIDGTYLDCNVAFARDYLNLDREDIIGKKDIEIMKDEKELKTLVEVDSKIIETKEKQTIRIKREHKNKIKYMETIKTPILNKNGEVWGIVGISRDMTVSVLAEKDLKKLTYKDKLTGAYNRSYFEKKIESLKKDKYMPLSLIMGDVDGLKIVNDTIGHLEGDKLLMNITRVIKNICRREDLVIRWGGDEIIILLPNTDYDSAKKVCERIREACKEEPYTFLPLSISLGCATKTSIEDNIEDIIKEAEGKVYKEKLPQRRTKTYMIESLQNTLKERSPETHAHSERVVKYSKRLGEALNLTRDKMEDLIVSAKLHDIGKIAIPDEILRKPSKLAEEEMEVVKMHTEKGYRIVKMNPNIGHIAKTILSHHERWDGNGYPFGLKKEEIPYLSRIIAVADSYDAMTSLRSYRKPVSNEEALREIKRCSGTQFDPEIAYAFINLFTN